ncbi:MAG: ABC transporter permease [Desulfobacterales bacterium]|jgi:putative ABC transport system permease protein
MISNFCIFAVRLLRRDKLHSIINTIGLSIGIACCIIIMMYLQNELRYDQYHEKADRIYRLGIQITMGDQSESYAQSSWSIGNRLKNEYSEIKEYARVRPYSGVLFKFEEKVFFEDEIALADPSVFKIFSFNFIYGNPLTCLNEPGNLVLTESLARKYFGDQNPIGKIVQLANKYDCDVTAVVEDMPHNSHMRLNALVAMASLSVVAPEVDFDNLPLMEADCYTFLLVEDDFALPNFLEKFKSFRTKFIVEEEKRYHQKYDPIFLKLADIHYGPYLRFDYPTGNKVYIYAFFTIGIFILALACINYINLATARALVRAKEIGIKKILGADRHHLVFQLLAESLIATLIALLIALALVELITSTPFFNQLLNGSFQPDLLNNAFFLYGLLGLWLFIGLFSGLYPALYFSTILPVKALCGTLTYAKSESLIRRSLVTFQFIISIAVAVFAVFMHVQIDFMRNRNMGFKKENVVSIKLHDDANFDKLPGVLEELRRHPDIISITTAHTRPGRAWTGLISVEGKNGMEEHNFYRFLVNYDFLETLGIELLKGRDFDANRPSDKDNAVIVNEKFVESMGWENPIGKRLTRGLPDEPGFSGEIIGVVKNFNFYSLHHKIEPLWLSLQHKVGGTVIVRIKSDRIGQTIDILKESWKQIHPGYPFVYSFLDREFDRFYDVDRKQNQLINIFSFMCVVISCLGLLGLTSFNTSRRIKEVAIRKIYGASATRIILMLFKEILYLMLLASILAIPLALVLIRMWVQNFAYRSDINVLIFIAAALVALAIAFLTTGYHCYRVARSNPVDTLRYE